MIDKSYGLLYLNERWEESKIENEGKEWKTVKWVKERNKERLFRKHIFEVLIIKSSGSQQIIQSRNENKQNIKSKLVKIPLFTHLFI